MPSRVRVKQRDITDCGAACLASIAAYYRLQMPVARIRQKAGTDKKGTNILGLIEAAEYLGFDARGVKGPFEALSTVPLPVIVHVVVKKTLHHYYVLYRVDKKTVTIMDPGQGRLIRMSHEAFKQEWTGVVVLLSPSQRFQKGNQKTSHGSRFWQLIRPELGLVAGALLAAIIYTVLGLSTAIYVQKIVDFVLVDGNLRLLNLMSVIMIGLLLFQLAFGMYKSVFSLQAGQRIDRRLILGYYKHLLRLPQRFFDTMRVGEIISRVNDAVKIRAFINEVALSLIVNILIIGFSLAVMFIYYWKLALLILAVVPFYILIYMISNAVNRRWMRRLMEQSAELEAHLVESLHAAGTIKRFGIEMQANEKTDTRFSTLLGSIYRTGIYGISLGTGSELVTRIFTIIVLWAGSYFVLQRHLSPGELLSFYSLIAYFTGPASSLIGANKAIQDALIAADRLFEIIDLEIEQSDEPRITLLPELMGDILFDNVFFRYGTRTEVFKGLNLAILKGQSTGIVGESGSGKSTLLSLLQNLYPLQEGKIRIGQFDLRQISNASLRQVVGVVPQDITLFTGTIIENIALGDFNPDLKKIVELSVRLGIHEFIEKLPYSYGATVSEHGVNFSGGQKQRIAIARALYRDPEILILDEATSALDPVAEEKVQQTLQWYKSLGKTIIIIAHRLKTVRPCDRILVLHQGSLVEEGSHNELMEKQERYFQMNL
ncbi:MAG: peptidase domain-containing ABC transporter [Saprospiraceae bacterium]|nr:peptidase domain-containing ABC transporter [Saprospiraceae bacterium]